MLLRLSIKQLAAMINVYSGINPETGHDVSRRSFAGDAGRRDAPTTSRPHGGRSKATAATTAAETRRVGSAGASSSAAGEVGAALEQAPAIGPTMRVGE